MKKQEENCFHSFPDHQQNYWQLACIQAAALGLPGILIGGYLSARDGFGSTILSIVIGNIILWMIGFSIISMAAPNRDNAIENAERYLGKLGGIFSAIFLIIAFLSWYILQISSAVSAIDHLINKNINTLRLGAALGFLTSLLSLGGIYLIKRLSTIFLPILAILSIYLAYFSNYKIEASTPWFISISGIIAVIAVGFPGTINLPTFFRHSKSRADSYLGLSLLIFITIGFQIFSVCVNYTNPSSLPFNNLTQQITLIILTLLSLISVNLVNIYFASAGWEMIFPHRRSVKDYVIVGLLGTMAFTFLQISKPMEFLEEMADNFIASLGMILLLAFLVKIIVKHRPRPHEQFINIVCWFFGGILSTITQALYQREQSEVLLIAVGGSCILFLTIIFIEETTWATRKIFFRKRK